MAKKAGFSSEQIHALRRSAATSASGSVPVVVTRVCANFTSASSCVSSAYAEIISAISAILFTNMVNRVNDTVVDFPKAD
jgi:hypothetical protein